MLAMLLGWTKLPQWAIELIALSAVAGAILLWHHETYEAGVKAAVAAVQVQDQKDRAALQSKADAAEVQSEQANAALQHYRDTTPVAPVRLCLTASHPSVQTASAQPERSGAAPSSGNIQPVPPRDNRSGTGTAGPDISGLLEALAARADQVNIQARELQGVQ